ncbi:hypothetical protein RZS08_31260, partial [Arthrospira platensis SPKY1]|nr:hypothetical protein [Arthrospira platensis SPKY1]
TGTTADRNIQNLDANQFDSTFENYTYSQRNWTTGGGWLRQKTIHTETITETGFKNYFTHYLRADYPIIITAAKGVGTPGLNITSVGSVIFRGNVSLADGSTDAQGNALPQMFMAIDTQGDVLFA